jgi:putative ABC transport system ATP-binding protein
MSEAVAAPLIRLRHVSRVYGQGQAAVYALRDVDLDIARGDFVAVMGPSGSGKSTVMNLIGCLDTPTSGEYLFEGVPVHTMTRNQRALLRRHQLGFVFQGFNLLPRTSAQENVELPLLYRGADAATRHRQAREALVTEPVVLLADEPTGNLDSQRSREIMDLLRSLNVDRGITIVMVTHESDMAAYAGRIVRFVDGRVASDQRNQAARPAAEPA